MRKEKRDLRLTQQNLQLKKEKQSIVLAEQSKTLKSLENTLMKLTDIFVSLQSNLVGVGWF